MAADVKLSHTTSIILQAIDAGFIYGFSIMEVTGLPSGTVYPALRRLEEEELVRSRHERQAIADREQRPPRKYYELTKGGTSTLQASRKRYPLLQQMIPMKEPKLV
jgi:DNA-binding PadR family transcriptional regulator